MLGYIILPCLYTYVRHQRAWILTCFSLILGIDFNRLGLKSGKVSHAVSNRQVFFN